MNFYLDLINESKLALVVYSPDAVKSSLIGHIEQYILSETRCYPVFRKWFNHSPASIEQFYQNNLSKITPFWHLVNELFCYSSSMVVLWKGDDVINKISKIKGASNPYIAKTNSIRSKFLSDNSVCNLIHVSDSKDDAIREIKVLEKAGLKIEQSSENNAVRVAEKSSLNSLRHNGIIEFCNIVQKIILLNGDKCNFSSFDDLKNPIDINLKCKKWLSEISKICTGRTKKIIDCYLHENTNALDLIYNIKLYHPLDIWSSLVIRCSILSKDTIV